MPLVVKPLAVKSSWPESEAVEEFPEPKVDDTVMGSLGSVDV